MKVEKLIDWLAGIIVVYRKDHEDEWVAEDTIYFGDIIGKLRLLEKIQDELYDSRAIR